MTTAATSASSTVVSGVWTPWAEVLCRPCHGPKFLETTIPADEHERLCASISEEDVPEGDDVTSCDHCKRRCHVSDKVAREHELVLALKPVLGHSVSMEQTGGMCSAVGVSLPGGQESIFIVASDESEEPRYLAGILNGDSCEEIPLDAEGREADNWAQLTREQAVEVARRVFARHSQANSERSF